MLLQAWRFLTGGQDVQDLQEETNHGLPGWALMIPALRDWQRKKQKSHKPACGVIVFPCAIRAANASEHPFICFNQCHLTRSLPLARSHSLAPTRLLFLASALMLDCG